MSTRPSEPAVLFSPADVLQMQGESAMVCTPGEMANKPRVLPRLVDVKDAATMLAVSQRTVWRLVELGQLPAPLHIGRAARWRVTDLMAFIYSGDLQAEAE